MIPEWLNPVLPGSILQIAKYAITKWPTYCAKFSIGSMHSSVIPKQWPSLIHYYNLYIFHRQDLWFHRFRGTISQRKSISLVLVMVPKNRNWDYPWPFWSSMPLNQSEEKRSLYCAWCLMLMTRGKLGCSYSMGPMRTMFVRCPWLTCLLVFPYPVVFLLRKL